MTAGVEATLAEAGPALLAGGGSPYASLRRWIHQFREFVVTKQGLAAVLQSGDPCYDPLHAHFLEHLEPVCAGLLDAAVRAGEIRPGQDANELMRGVGSICAGAGHPRYDPGRLIDLLVAGLAAGRDQ